MSFGGRPLRVRVPKALRFLRAITPAGAYGNIVAIHPTTGQCTGIGFKRDDLGPVEKFIEQYEDHNLYWTVNALDRLLNKKPTKADIARMRYAHLDLDDPTAEALQRIRRADPPPTRIIFSGGGYGAFWRLTKPVRANGNIEQLEAVNQHLIDIFGAGKGTQNLDRIMRLPWTVNHLNDKKRRDGRQPAATYVVERHPERVYTLEQLRGMTCAPPSQENRKAGRAKPTPPSRRGAGPSTNKPPDRSRSGNLWCVVGYSVAMGWTDEQIHAKWDTHPHAIDQPDPFRSVQRCINAHRTKSR